MECKDFVLAIVMVVNLYIKKKEEERKKGEVELVAPPQMMPRNKSNLSTKGRNSQV
jgi:hypothetical protein